MNPLRIADFFVVVRNPKTGKTASLFFEIQNDDSTAELENKAYGYHELHATGSLSRDFGYEYCRAVFLADGGAMADSFVDRLENLPINRSMFYVSSQDDFVTFPVAQIFITPADEGTYNLFGETVK
jgi:hypothetical protein